MNIYTPFGLMLIVCIFGVVLIALLYRLLKVRDHTGLDSRRPTQGPQNAGEEKREHPRNDVNWPASIETPDGPSEAQIKNISLSGAFICCKRPLPLKTVFRLTMTGPDNEPVAATAEVVWSNVNLPDEKVVNRGMGVRFIKMSDRHIQLVKKVLQESS